MRGARVIPCLLLKGRQLVKTVTFAQPKYVGDPINAVRIFNEKEVDELVLLDITATVEDRSPDLKLIAEIAGECFMPLCYGGGVRTLESVKEILNIGAEKVCLNTSAIENPAFVAAAAGAVGSQSIMVSIDVKRTGEGRYEVFTHRGRRPTGREAVACAVQMQELGAGELFLNSIDRDGTMQGYDLELVRQVTEAVHIPVIACGGAGRIQDLADAVRGAGASAVAAGSLFVFYGKHRAVLINYPTSDDLSAAFA